MNPYGTMVGTVGDLKGFQTRSQRQRLNIVSVCQCLFLPWMLFCVVNGMMSFYFHYSHPTTCKALVGICFLAVVVCIGAATKTSLQRMSNPLADSGPSWTIFLAVTMLLSWVIAVILGDLTFWTYMQPYYDYTNLNEYYYVDASQMRGQQLMDVGRANFANGTTLDLKRSMGFKNLDTYCVAPITMNDMPLAAYDFWAVGLDCCTGNMADFHCGEFNNPKAQGGLRLLRDDQRDYFRLAVQQAEATYSIKAIHPLFFYWAQDPTSEMEAFREEGVKYFMIGMFAHFFWQLFAVGLATCGFAKMNAH